MQGTGSAATRRIADMLTGPSGVDALVLASNDSDILENLHVVEQFISADVADKSGDGRYPVAYVYCDRLTNGMREKFRSFSGSASISIDARVTHDHAAELGTQLQSYIKAITDVLDRARGDWGEGMFYAGGYEIVFSPVRRGGKNFTQGAVVRLEVNISVP